MSYCLLDELLVLLSKTIIHNYYWIKFANWIIAFFFSLNIIRSRSRDNERSWGRVCANRQSWRENPAADVPEDLGSRPSTDAAYLATISQFEDAKEIALQESHPRENQAVGTGKSWKRPSGRREEASKKYFGKVYQFCWDKIFSWFRPIPNINSSLKWKAPLGWGDDGERPKSKRKENVFTGEERNYC